MWDNIKKASGYLAMCAAAVAATVAFMTKTTYDDQACKANAACRDAYERGAAMQPVSNTTTPATAE